MMRISLAQNIVDEAAMEIESILQIFGVKIVREKDTELLQIIKNYDEHQYVSVTLNLTGD